MAGLALETLVVSKGTVEGVYQVELNRPEVRNAMNRRFWNEMKQVFEALHVDSDCRVIVLSARGKSFSAGLDVTDTGLSSPSTSPDAARQGLRLIGAIPMYQDAMTAIEQCLKPTIAVVHGACIGGGIDLITACDVRLCSSEAYFSVREVAVGLAADVGTLARLPKVVGNDSVVRELALTGRDFRVDEAKAMGLVSRVLPTKDDALKDALAIAGVIAGMSPVAVVGTKKNLNYARDHSVSDALDYVRTWNACMLQTEDASKAMAAAMRKTKPTFSKL